jgi:hypothetical protein
MNLITRLLANNSYIEDIVNNIFITTTLENRRFHRSQCGQQALGNIEFAAYLAVFIALFLPHRPRERCEQPTSQRR